MFNLEKAIQNLNEISEMTRYTETRLPERILVEQKLIESFPYLGLEPFGKEKFAEEVTSDYTKTKLSDPIHPLEYSIDTLSTLVKITDSDLNGAKVADFGCGSSINDKYSFSWRPYKAEVLTRLGANVDGFDIRINPSASYNHIVSDFSKPEHLEKIKNNYDIVIMTHLLGEGLTHDSTGFETIDKLLELTSKPNTLYIVTGRFNEPVNRIMKKHGIKVENEKSRRDIFGYK